MFVLCSIKLVYYLSSEFAFGSLRDLLIQLDPPPQKREKNKDDNLSLSEPKANSEER